MLNLEHISLTKDFTHVPYLRRAYEYAMLNSDDKRTRVGAYIPISDSINLLGANRFVGGYTTSENKYDYVIHAETAVILKAAKYGISIENTTLYAPWFACIDCAKNIIGSGISRVVGHKLIMDKTPERWEKSINTALDMLHTSGIELVLYDGKINSRIIFDNLPLLL